MRAVRRSASLVAVLAALWGLWEGWHWIGTHFDLTWPFAVNDITMPHLHRIVQALFEPAQVNGPWLIDILWHASLFTAKESAVGFALGAVIGFAIAVVLSQSRFLERGFIPYIVASQTVPLLAIAPMVVVGLGSKGVRDWVSVAVLAAYLTFFPVSIVGAIISEPAASIQGGLGGAIVNFNQYYSIEPQELWATNVVAAVLGIGFFLVVVGAEKALVRRAPENVA